MVKSPYNTSNAYKADNNGTAHRDTIDNHDDSKSLGTNNINSSDKEYDKEYDKGKSSHACSTDDATLNPRHVAKREKVGILEPTQLVTNEDFANDNLSCDVTSNLRHLTKRLQGLDADPFMESIRIAETSFEGPRQRQHQQRRSSNITEKGAIMSQPDDGRYSYRMESTSKSAIGNDVEHVLDKHVTNVEKKL